MSALAFDDITVTYTRTTGEPLVALSSFSLNVPHGTALSIIGPSGCGKSTLLRLAAGLAQPSSGHVLVDGAALQKPRLGTAFILQDYGLLPWKSVYNNAELGLRIARVPKAQRKPATTSALEQVGLEHFAHAYPAELSGGMQQRLALARAIAANADTLLMDEPLSALDSLLRERMQNTLLELWQRNAHTQILVTHSIEEAVFLGQRIIVLSPRPGRIVADIANPLMGTQNFRAMPEYFEICTRVRTTLAQATAAQNSNTAGNVPDISSIAESGKTDE